MSEVYKAINNVTSDLARSGVGKDATNKFDNYQYRSIDGLYNALAPVLAKHKLCILPKVVSSERLEGQSQKGTAQYTSVLEVEFDFVSAEDDSKHTIKVVGEGTDRGDKATNKAMSAAFKYACFMAFCIPFEGTDSEADSPKASAGRQQRPAKRPGASQPLSEAEAEADQTFSGGDFLTTEEAQSLHISLSADYGLTENELRIWLANEILKREDIESFTHLTKGREVNNVKAGAKGYAETAKIGQERSIKLEAWLSKKLREAGTEQSAIEFIREMFKVEVFNDLTFINVAELRKAVKALGDNGFTPVEYDDLPSASQAT